MSTPIDPTDREYARAFLQARDALAMDMLAFSMGLAGVDPIIATDMFTEELEKLDHETQEWWGKPCNCTGAHN